MFKPSRRALAIAASFALGLSAVGPAAHAGLLGGGDSESALGGDLLGGGLLGILGGESGLLGGVLGGESGLLGGVLGGEAGLLGGVLGGGGLPVVGALGGGGGGLPLVGDVLGGGLPLLGGGEEGLGGALLGGEMLDVVTDTTLHCDAAIPQVLWALLGDVTEAVCAPFSYGISGLLGSL